MALSVNDYIKCRKALCEYYKYLRSRKFFEERYGELYILSAKDAEVLETTLDIYRKAFLDIKFKRWFFSGQGFQKRFKRKTVFLTQQIIAKEYIIDNKRG